MRIQSLLGLFMLLSLALAPVATQAQVRTEQDPAGRQQQRESVDRQQPSRDATARHATDGQTKQDLAYFLAARLALMNQAEIEVAKLAASQATSPEVKQLAQSIAQDHHKLNQRLAQAVPELTHFDGLNGQSIASPDGRIGQAADQRPGALSQPAQRQAGQPDAAQQAGQPPRSDSIDRDNRVAESNRAQAGQPDATATIIRAQSGGDFNDGVGRILLDTCRRATENQVRLAKQMLQSKQGNDFDACWVGGQVFAHQMMLAELGALENMGTQEFQQVAQTAAQVAQQHLEQAEQLAERLTSDR